MTKSKSFIFTWNNPDISLDELESLARLDEAVTFTGQLEKGASGTPHYQFMIVYKNERHAKSVMKKWPHCHVESTRSAFNSYMYC